MRQPTKVKRPKQIAIIGSTGSIGRQTLEVIAGHPGMFRASVLVAGKNLQGLISQARQVRPEYALIADEGSYKALREALEPLGIKTAAGEAAINDIAASESVESVVTAVVGYDGLAPTVRAIGAGKEIALANKETLVVAGELVTGMAKKSKSKIYPVDSEHSAIYQCLAGERLSTVKKLIITASGGPFLRYAPEPLERVAVGDALRHPNWSMGAKITIDSATMMNKAFEIIEARWLFGIAPERIEAVVHPQSIVHSMVEFVDGAIKAQLGLPDMRLPIMYALAGGKRLASRTPSLSLEDCSKLTFERPDTERFPCLRLGHYALGRGGNTACAINAANEVAVEAFLQQRIGFGDIYRIIEKTLERTPHIGRPCLEDYANTNAEARRYAASLVKKQTCKS